MKITKEARNIFLFMMIGDGCISKTGVLEIAHCAAQKEYLFYKKSLLESVGIKCGNIRDYNNNGYPASRFAVKTYKFAKLYRKVFYTPKKTIANRKLLNKLTPLGLAIWYMDDGGLSQKKRNGVVHANDLIINTHLSIEENQIIIDYFNEVWNIRFTQVKNHNQYRLRCGTIEARKFIAIVEPYVSKMQCMLHKINIKKK